MTNLDHNTDADCVAAGTVDPETHDCSGCGVGGGDVCRGCGGERYHFPGCTKSDEAIEAEHAAEDGEPCNGTTHLCGLCKSRQRVTTIVIQLEIQGEQGDALTVVDAMLDNGDPQDQINDHENESAGPLHVLAARVFEVQSDAKAQLSALADIRDLLWPASAAANFDGWKEATVSTGIVSQQTLRAIYDRLAFLKPGDGDSKAVHCCCRECGWQEFLDPATQICSKCGKTSVPTSLNA